MPIIAARIYPFKFLPITLLHRRPPVLRTDNSYPGWVLIDMPDPDPRG
jgi:hypothetical protein